MFQFLLADCCGNWDLHLQTASMMLSFMASAGHHKYATCLTRYLTDIDRMPEELSDKFLQGHFTVRDILAQLMPFVQTTPQNQALLLSISKKAVPKG